MDKSFPASSCWFAAALLLAITVCGPSPVDVHGRVLLDGAPLDEAVISFIPQGIEGQRESMAGVEHGRYDFAPAGGLLPGKYRVEVADAPPVDPSGMASHAAAAAESQSHRMPMTPSFSERRKFPHRYSYNSPLTATVSPENTRFDFELTLKP